MPFDIYGNSPLKVTLPSSGAPAARRVALSTDYGAISIPAEYGDVFVQWGDSTVDADTSSAYQVKVPAGSVFKAAVIGATHVSVAASADFDVHIYEVTL